MRNKKGCILSVLLVLFIFGVSIPLFMTNHTKVKAQAITDLSNTTWILNQSINITFDYTFSINSSYDDISFTTFDLQVIQNGNRTFRGLSLDNYELVSLTMDDNPIPCYANLPLTFTGGTDKSNSSLISWLQANATQQGGATTTQITHRYWSPYGVIRMTDNQVIGDEEISYTVKYNEFTNNYDETTQTGLKFLGVQANDPNVQWSYIESINGVGINILYHGTTNNINNAMWLEFTYGDYMDTELYDFMDQWGYWFDDDNAYLVGTNQGYAEGTQHGIALGQADGTQYTTLISNIFNGIGGLLSIQVFPNITIGLLIGLPLLLGVLVIILKILRG